jgi:ribosomal subunit interface protein
MRLELTGRHVEISPGLRNLVTRKLVKVERLLNDTGVSAAVVLAKERVNHVVEVTLHARGEHFLHAVGKDKSWATAMTKVIAKVLHQGERLKGTWQERKRRGPAARSVKAPKEAPPTAVRPRTPARRPA